MDGPFIRLRRDNKLPNDGSKERLLRLQATKYLIYNGKLYHWGFNILLLRCVAEEDAAHKLKKVHEGICGNHFGGHALAQKMLRKGYDWPIMKKDV